MVGEYSTNAPYLNKNAESSERLFSLYILEDILD